jgi:hypothetical protein
MSHASEARTIADMLASASIFNSLARIAVDVISLFMALLSSRGISTPSLQARGEQRRFFHFNNDRDIPPGQPRSRSNEKHARSHLDLIGLVNVLRVNRATAQFALSHFFVLSHLSYGGGYHCKGAAPFMCRHDSISKLA